MRELRVVTTNESDEVDGIIGRKADDALPLKIRLVEVKFDSSVVPAISAGIVTAGVAAAERFRIVTSGRCGIWILEDIRNSPRIAEFAEPSLAVEVSEIGGVLRTVAKGVPERKHAAAAWHENASIEVLRKRTAAPISYLLSWVGCGDVQGQLLLSSLPCSPSVSLFQAEMPLPDRAVLPLSLFIPILACCLSFMFA